MLDLNNYFKFIEKKTFKYITINQTDITQFQNKCINFCLRIITNWTLFKIFNMIRITVLLILQKMVERTEKLVMNGRQNIEWNTRYVLKIKIGQL